MRARSIVRRHARRIGSEREAAEREGDGYVAPCPELDIASQRASVEEARRNLREAVELFFETADASEVQAPNPDTFAASIG